MDREYKVPSRRQPIFAVVRTFFRLFYRRPRIINLAGEIPDKCIILSNHAAKSGPMALELYFPKFNVKWGAHEMMEDYTSRRNYLRDVYYIRKRGMNKFLATFSAGFEAIFSKMIYKGMKFIPTFTDTRLMRTINDSVKVLDANAAIMIFPENSNEGYHEELTEFFSGFVMLATKYFRLRGEDVPVYPVYYHGGKRLLIIDKPLYVNKTMGEGKSRSDIAEIMRLKVNQLYHRYVLDGDIKPKN